MLDQHDGPFLTDEPEPRSADADYDQEMEDLLQAVDDEQSSDQKNIETLLARIDELETSVRAMEDEKLRTLAENQNFRRRMQEQAETTRKFANENLVRELIPALDNFERTLAASQNGATLDNLLIGVRMIDKQIRDALRGLNVERIVALGQQFDPEVHEAIATVPTEGKESGEVVDELEAGYTMNGRVLRAARVRVAE
ncbi:MAG: nucleotide exchange factor GrpE [Chthonomonas sp.]|nr:nucleotide exchange factor GrpE [Chthonomonas sp.]